MMTRLSMGLLAAALAGCAGISTTQSGVVGVDRKQYVSGLVPQAQLEQEARNQYQAVLNQARSQGRLDRDATQLKRIKSITQRLVAQVPVFRGDARDWDWEVHLISEDEVNAWCMPGGKMAVYSGLVQRIQPTDDELAAVLGHEIAHALREHARERVSQQMAAQLGLTVLSILTGSQRATDLGSNLSQVMFTLPNSRSHESEADLIGVELAARAGYDPRAAVTLWQKMGAAQGAQTPPEFLSTHPSAATRIGDLQQAAQRVMPLYEQSRR